MLILKPHDNRVIRKTNGMEKNSVIDDIMDDETTKTILIKSYKLN